MMKLVGNLTLAATSLLLGCREPTQITVELGTDVHCDEVWGTNLTAGVLGEVEDQPPSLETQACRNGRIGSIVLVPSDSSSDKVALRTVTGVGKLPADCIEDDYVGGCIVARRALSYIPHTPLVLPIDMTLDCLDVACDERHTCYKGGCVTAEVDDPEDCTGDNPCLPGTPEERASLDDAAPEGGSGGVGGAEGGANAGGDSSSAGEGGSGGASEPFSPAVPVAAFSITPPVGEVSTVFSVDAGESSDAEDSFDALSFDWDWESDGVYDDSGALAE
ncbi:MAG TPA: hypothetical protein VM686_07475, partial [Polyangiaceae bacterium]|nr:hypothetical protein [Polyangiaceae bacterium]